MVLYQTAVLLLLLAVAGLVRRNLLDYRRPPARAWGNGAPRVSILVPARDEAWNIGPCLARLRAQEYPAFEIVVLDDMSTDGTPALVAAQAAVDPRVRLARGRPLPRGWAGKSHACWEAAACARGEWLLFMDADTRAEPELVARAIGEAMATGADLLSTFPRQEVGTAGEALTVPLIYWVLFTLLPIRQVWEHPAPAYAAACGQFLLVRRETYWATGGHAAIAGSLHDGLHLARLFKRHRRRVRLADLSGDLSCRMYRGGWECWQGFSRNAYQAIGSPAILLLLTAVKTTLFLGPFVSLAAAALGGWPGWSCLAVGQVVLLWSIHAGLRCRFHYPWLTALLHPVGILLLLAIEWRSAWLAGRGRSLVWKGRPVQIGGGRSRKA